MLMHMWGPKGWGTKKKKKSLRVSGVGAVRCGWEGSRPGLTAPGCAAGL